MWSFEKPIILLWWIQKNISFIAAIISNIIRYMCNMPLVWKTKHLQKTDVQVGDMEEF